MEEDQRQQQQPQHYAFVSSSEPLELPSSSNRTASPAQQRQPSPQETLVKLYQSYAERFPNPRLIEEYQERDQLLQATSAAHLASSTNRRQQAPTGKGWFGSLFGGGSSSSKSKSKAEVPTAVDHEIISPEEEAWLEYTEVVQEEEEDQENDLYLCGTHHHSLDRSCIPPEAHSMARLSLASSSERPLVVRASPHLPCPQTYVVVDLGTIAEFDSSHHHNDNQQPPNYNSSYCTATGDREYLRQYASTRGGFDLARVRAASIGPNFMVVSWGFSDGIVVFYRKIHFEDSDIAWEPVVFMSPSQAVLDHSYDAYVDEEDEDANSAVLRITDIVPMVVTTPGMPAAALAVSRLGGYMEVLPVPPPLWYGPVFSPDKHKPRGGRRKRNNNNRQHYAKPYLVDVSSDKAPIPVLALTTMEYQMDILCMEAIRTRVTFETEWDRELYGNAPPPAEYVLVASGTKNGSEVLTFWSVSYMFAEEPPNDGSAGFMLHAVLQEALEVGPVGNDLSIFANRAILNQWRHPRKVALKEQPPPPPAVAINEEEEGGIGEESTHREEERILDDNLKPPSVYDRVTTITVSAPILEMQSITVPTNDETSQMVLLSLLDWNGSVTVLDCSFLERMVSHSLFEEEYRIVREADMAPEQGEEQQEPPPVPPLVKVLVDRSLMMAWMKSSQASSSSSSKGLMYHCKHAQWLARPDNVTDPWLILLTAPVKSTSHKSRIMIMSGFLGSQENLEHPSIQTVAFPTVRATLQGSTVPSIAQDGTVTPTSMLRMVFPPKKQSHNLCMCLLQPLESQDIISSLARDGKYKQALAAAQELSPKDQEHVRSTLEECRQQLWEQSGDLTWLKQATDDAYVVRQALSFFELEQGSEDGNESNAHLENIDVDTCRDICSIALQRVSKLRLGSALTLCFGTEDARSKLQGMLIRLGTYELLCQALNAELSFRRFRQMFTKAPLVDLAKSLATLSDLTSLSILWFRHAKELQPHLIDILSLIPMTLDPTRFCHLLPVAPGSEEQGVIHSSLFLTGIDSSEGKKLLHKSQLPSHLKETYGFNVVLDGNDEKMVLDHNSTDNSRVGDEVDVNGSLLAFYVSRARDMQLFSGNLQHVADFCALGLLATSRTCMDQENTSSAEHVAQSVDTSTHELYRTWGCAVALQKMLVESASDTPMERQEGGLQDLEPFVTITPLDLSAMELADIVKMVLGGQDDPDIIIDTYNEYLLPLLKFLPAEGRGDLDVAIKSYCIDAVRSSVFYPMEEQMDGFNNDDAVVVDDTEDGTLKALQICRAMAHDSRTTIKKSNRIIKEKKVLISMVITAIFEVSLRFENVSLPTRVCHSVVKLLWDMYESLPDDTDHTTSSDEEFIELMSKANDVYRDLVGVDILSRWPECHAQALAFLTKRTRFREEAIGNGGAAFFTCTAPGQEALASMCHSFCSQAAAQKGAVALSGLLRDLTSDIDQLHKISYDNEEAFLSVIVATLSAELIAPLFQQREFELIGQFLFEADTSWWDKEQEARTVRTYVDEIIFGDNKSHSSSANALEENSLQSAMACQDALGPVFPEMQSGFQSVRRYLDAAHFINTVIFAELSMPKPITPNDLRGDLPLDVVESILRALPKAIVIGCKEWAEPSLAVHANKALREYQEKTTETQDGEPEKLPPIPGGAVFHLAGILGLEDTSSVLVVKSRVVHYGVASSLFGAAAAVCRTILYDDNAFSSPADSIARLAAVAEVVTQEDYEDLATKRELCSIALQKHNGELYVETCAPFDEILSVYAFLEAKTSEAQSNENKPFILNLPPPSDSMGCLYKDTWGQYSVNIYDLLSTLQQHCSSGIIDDSLLNALSRYVFFCCIFRSTRPRTEHPGKLEKATSNQLLILGAALLLHIKDTTSISIPALKELRQILEKQAMAVINQHPTAFEDLVKLPDENVVRELVGRGFTPMAARRSALATRNVGTQQALQWGIANARDPRMNDLIIFVFNKRNVFVDKMSIQQIMNTFAFTGQFLSGAKSPEDWLREHPTPISAAPISPSSTKPTSNFNAAGMNGKPVASTMPTKAPEKPVQETKPPSQPKLITKLPTQTSDQFIPTSASASLSAPAMKTTAVQAQAPRPGQEKTGNKAAKPRSTFATAPTITPAAPPPPPPKAPVVAPAPPLRPPAPPTAVDTEVSYQGTLQATAPGIATRSIAQTSSSIPNAAKDLQSTADSTRQGPTTSTAPGLSIKAGPGPSKPTNSLITPLNRPPSLQLKSTGSSTSSDYETLKKRGEAAMESMRSTPRTRERNKEEKRRLIEAGRRLLAKSRASNRATPPNCSTGDNAQSFGRVSPVSKMPSLGSTEPPNALAPPTVSQSSWTSRIGNRLAPATQESTSGKANQPPPSTQIAASTSAGGLGIAMGSPGDNKPEANKEKNGWDFDAEDPEVIESAMEESDRRGFENGEANVSTAAPLPVSMHTTATDMNIKKLPTDDGDGWDFDDF